MPRTLRFMLASLLMAGAASVRPSTRLLASEGGDGGVKDSPPHATLKPASAPSPDLPFLEYDAPAEQLLLELANQARAEVGAPRLMLDAGLAQAARTHAQAMVASGQLAHQFAGEASLSQRLASSTHTQLDQEGENVALDFDPAQAHLHLMLSPPHRANLLNADYNVAGMAVARAGNRLYVVQDFGRALPSYSVTEVKETIAAAVARARNQADQPPLLRRELASADPAACSMAQADRLGTSPIHQLVQRYTLLTYTSLHPESLPENAGRTLASHNLRSFSVGACYARTETYPTGVYWVVLALE